MKIGGELAEWAESLLMLESAIPRPRRGEPPAIVLVLGSPIFGAQGTHTLSGLGHVDIARPVVGRPGDDRQTAAYTGRLPDREAV
jgi:hypothetical protein